ncbi:biliverdin-producing heme oxygenase [Actinoplanes sp. NPDC026623]|uniref:biliverdin-producing heme oxygenase n=1 Tax=Actinoplanes sp. NPDC026623 TaxID=3155610 RepID=UPI0033F0518C
MDGAGRGFFVFEGISPPAFRTRYRELLDQGVFTPDDEGNSVAEVVEAHRLNIAVLRELKERWQ